MKKIITFGDYTAKLYAGEHRASLVMSDRCLPVGLADVLDVAGDIHVHNVSMTDDGLGCIDITHDLSASDLLSEVCDAITFVYDTDAKVSKFL